MRTNPHTLGHPILILAAFALNAPSPAQEAAAVAATPEAEIRYQVQSSRTVPLPDGRNLILQCVSPPGLPPAPPVVVRPPLTPEQLAARRAAQPAPHQQRVLALNVTVYAENLSYIEWWPDPAGGSFGAWSSADFRYLSMVPEFDLVTDNTRYLLFPFVLHSHKPRPGSPPLILAPVPADGLGFIVVKGDASQKESVNPIAALHQIYKEEAPQLKAAWEERERVRLEEEAWRAANPPPPPGDLVIRFWPVQSQTYSTTPVVPSTLSPGAQ